MKGTQAEQHPVPLLADLAAAAKSCQQALFPGNGDKVGYWLTPSDIIEPLHAEFAFNFDACPFPRPAGFDGLKEEWGTSTWANPPFVGPGSSFVAWTKKALAERAKGKSSVLILPVDNWLRLMVEGGAEIRSVGVHDWIDAKTGKRRKSPRPSLLFILRGSP